MKIEALVSSCGLYCGFCRYYSNYASQGCGLSEREECAIYTCCRKEKSLLFYTECKDFSCEILGNSIGLHHKWLDE